MELRPYQKEAVDAVVNSELEKPLLIAATGAGKSVIIAYLIKHYIETGKTVLVLCHQSDILVHNYTAFERVCPDVRFSIFCASLKKDTTTNPVVFASRDTLGRSASAFGFFDVVICDEAHRLNTNKENSYYSRILANTKPSKVVGLTATPWRGNNERLDDPKKGFFDGICYDIGVRKLIDEGFLSEYKLPEDSENMPYMDVFDSYTPTENMADFTQEELAAVVNNKLTDTYLNLWNIARLKYNRKLSIFFCISVVHATMVSNALKEIDPNLGCMTVTGETDADERSEFFNLARNGKLDCIINVNVLTTGVDIPMLDCVVFLRPTMSVSLFIQMAGRGLRKHPDKDYMLLLDFAGNCLRFGSIEDPVIKEKADKELELTNLEERTDKLSNDVFDFLIDTKETRLDAELAKKIDEECREYRKNKNECQEAYLKLKKYKNLPYHALNAISLRLMKTDQLLDEVRCIIKEFLKKIEKVRKLHEGIIPCPKCRADNSVINDHCMICKTPLTDEYKLFVVNEQARKEKERLESRWLTVDTLTIRKDLSKPRYIITVSANGKRYTDYIYEEHPSEWKLKRDKKTAEFIHANVIAPKIYDYEDETETSWGFSAEKKSMFKGMPLEIIPDNDLKFIKNYRLKKV